MRRWTTLLCVAAIVCGAVASSARAQQDGPEADEVEAPDADAPESDEAEAPEEDLPEGDVPEADAPEADAPEADVPDARTPEDEAGARGEVPDAGTAARLGALEQRIDALEEQNEDLEREIEYLGEDQKFAEERSDKAMEAANRFGGYIDFGAFWVGGNGTGFRSDIGHEVFPEFDVPEDMEDDFEEIAGSWVFMGDPLATAINSRGEPADTGESRAVTYDGVDAGGEPEAMAGAEGGGVSSFILNTVNLSVFAGITEELTVDASVDLVPRKRDISDPDGTFLGDFVHIKRAYARYQPGLEAVDLRIYGGKFDSVLGNEYRTQEAPDRLGVTPSLICRYTCGYPIGVKGRLAVLDESLILNVAVTNGSHFSEYFPFHGETDLNHFKTVSGRLSYVLPIATGLEVGVSGAFGAQDLQEQSDTHQWHVGADLLFEWQRLILNAEFVQGEAEGRTEGRPEQRFLPGCNLAPCIEYRGVYGQIGVRALAWVIPYARVDWRDALHESGASFVYISQLVRGTVGLRLEFGPQVVLKAEYIVNRELGRIPEFSNDVFASSFVLSF